MGNTVTGGFIRLAEERDAEAVHAIYAPFCRDSPVTFELSAPDVAEMRARIARTLETHPWLVYEGTDGILGYVYASRHRDRAAYQWCVETAVYIREDARGAGLGVKLYAKLFELLRAQGYVNAYAGVSIPNPGSERLHERAGFRRIGVYEKIGFKGGHWRDVAWYALRLQDPAGAPALPVPFARLRLRTDFDELLGS